MQRRGSPNSRAHQYAHLWPGVPLALGAAALFGATPPLSKLLLETISPFMLAGLLYLGAGLGLAVYQLRRRAAAAGAGEAPLRQRELPWLLLAVGFGGVIAPVLLMSGLALTPASSGALLLNLEGLATMAVAWLVYRENVDWRLLLGAAAILSGAMLLSWEGQGIAFNHGAILVAGACFAWGLDNNFTRRISSADPAVIAMIKGLAAGSANIALAFLTGASLPAPLIIAAACAAGLLCVGVSLVMYILALRHLGTARTGAYFSLAPFIGAVLA
ncbi:MAG: DMT family transporter, partial [Beijerinckiaceae bacterium]|nr:DMT family transporter [Beijerinckiaceae bacterium]